MPPNMTEQASITQPMQIPLRSPKQFHAQYKNQNIVLRGPVPIDAFLEWLRYAKSVTVSTPRVE